MSAQSRRSPNQIVGLKHVRSGRVDGWYAREIDATDVLAWFRSTFPAEQFEPVTDQESSSIGYITRAIELKSADWKKWSGSPPDYEAGDRCEADQRAEGPA